MKTEASKIEDIWSELEREAGDGMTTGWLTRNARPDPSQPLLIALEVAPRRRALLLPLPSSSIPPKSEWPQCRGLEIFRGSFASGPFLGVRLQNPADSEVFSALAEDVAPRVAGTATPMEAASVLIGRLRKWQKFLAAGPITLGPNAVKALFGELSTLRELLIPSVGALEGVRAWVGPHRAHQDFQLPNSAIEVKTTAATGPQIVRISSERQLDAVGIGALFLWVLSLDERVSEGLGHTEGETLPELVESLRRELGSSPFAVDLLEDLLLEAGYRAIDVDFYNSRRFAVRRKYAFQVDEGFPKLTESGLPAGVGEITYALSLSACEAFAIAPDRLEEILKS